MMLKQKEGIMTMKLILRSSFVEKNLIILN